MPPFGTDQRPDDGQPIHPLSQTRQMFADIDARNVRRDWPEFATDLDGSLGFQVDHVLMRGAPRKKDHDDRLVRLLAGNRFRLEQLRQRQAAHRQCPGVQHRAAGKAITERKSSCNSHVGDPGT